MKEARGLRGIWSYVGRMRLMEVRHPDGRPAPDVYKKTPEEICFLQRQDGLSQDVERPDDEEEVSPSLHGLHRFIRCRFQPL